MARTAPIPRLANHPDVQLLSCIRRDQTVPWGNHEQECFLELRSRHENSFSWKDFQMTFFPRMTRHSLEGRHYRYTKTRKAASELAHESNDEMEIDRPVGLGLTDDAGTTNAHQPSSPSSPTVGSAESPFDSPHSNPDNAQSQPEEAESRVLQIVREVHRQQRAAQVEAELQELKQNLTAIRPLIIELSKSHKTLDKVKACCTGSAETVDSLGGQEYLWGLAEKLFPGIRDQGAVDNGKDLPAPSAAHSAPFPLIAWVPTKHVISCFA